VLPAGDGPWPPCATRQEHKQKLGVSKGLGWEVMAVVDLCGLCSRWDGCSTALFALMG